MPPPNLLLVTTDQHNAEIMGPAGNRVVKTPNLDRLAARGVNFTSAFTPFPICTPARTSIFTGQYAATHGVRHNINMNYQPGKPALPPETVAFPELLAKAGYHTSLFGKLHTRHEGGKNFGLQLARLVEGKCHFVPSREEPDEYRKYLAQKGYPDGAWEVWDRDPSYRVNGYVTSPFPDEDYVDTFIANMAVEHLSAGREPFFSWISFCTPHNPWDPPRPYDRMYDPADIPMPHRRRGELEEKPKQWVDHVARTIHSLPYTSQDPTLPGGVESAYARFPEEKTRRMLAAYYGQISHVDAQIGRLLDALEARGLLSSTLIVFTSDHGDYCGNNWAFYKYAGLYDSLIRVPFIVAGPGVSQPGRRSDSLISLIDLAPTFLELAGVASPGNTDGRSLRPVLSGGDCPWRDHLFVEGGPTRAVLTNEWKLVRWKDGTEELYNRRTDPHDLFNLAADESTLHVREGLESHL